MKRKKSSALQISTLCITAQSCFIFSGKLKLSSAFGRCLSVRISIFYGWSTVINYTVYRVNFSEAAFVVVIMALAATRPILKLSELIMAKIAGLLGGT